MSLQIVILAAGVGKRMFSQKPKVLHLLAGKPMLAWVIDIAQQLNPAAIHVVYGYGGEQIKKELPDFPVNWVMQENPLGTGHAVLQILPHIPLSSSVLILSADVPLIQVSTLQALLELAKSSKADKLTELPLALLVANLDNPYGLGRIIRNESGKICAIVEERDTSLTQKHIKEIYSGICCVNATDLAHWLPMLHCNNAQGEYYLTDIIAMAVAEQKSIISLTVTDITEIQGVNNRLQLQHLERIWQQRLAVQLLESGVSIADAARIDIRGELVVGQDVFIDINCVFIGKVVLGNDCQIGPNCVLTNVTLGNGCKIFANSVLDGCTLGNYCQVGPFARLRPGTWTEDFCKIGNFVETKKAKFGEGSKANHLTYLGDVDIGKQVNIGAGTITCNYDGAVKHQTIIGDGVNIGSDTQLVAPVTVGANATIGAGSTIRKDVPANVLALTESQQKTVFGWKRKTVKQSDQN